MSSKQLTTKRCCAYKSYILKSDVTTEEMKKEKKLTIIGTRKSKIIIIVLIQVIVVIRIITIANPNIYRSSEYKKMISPPPWST